VTSPGDLEYDPLRPPSVEAAEQAVLGAALLSAAALDDLEHFAADDLGDVRYRLLLERMRSMRALEVPVDLHTVGASLLEQPIRGLAPHHLVDFAGAVASVANASWYAQAVADAAARRRLLEAATRVRQMVLSADDGPGETADLLARARAELEAVTDGRAVAELEPIGVHLSAAMDDWDTEPDVIPTPWPDLNRIMHGWAPGRLYVIAARPGVGKSIMGAQAAAGVAKTGAASVVFSLEMTRTEILARLVSMVGKVDSTAIERRRLSDEDWTRVARAVGVLADLPLYVEDAVPLRVADIRAQVRAIARKTPVRLVVVDYLQLLAAPSRTSSSTPRQEVVAGFARSLKELAKELEVAVLALSQLNRASEQRANKRPSMADLRESGEIEQASDVVALLHRDDEDADPTAVDMILPKNRQGAQGSLALQFEGPYCRMVSPVRHLEHVPHFTEREAS
jgi:replicative DNA helicase